MTTDTLLIEKRDELKHRLAAGEYKTLVDKFLGWFERLLRKITRRTKPFPLWYITAVLYVLFFVATNAAIYLAGDWTTYLRNGESFGFGYQIGFLINISNGILIFIMAILTNRYINRFFILWQDTILDKTESLTSVKKIEDWLAKCCNWRLHLLITIVITIWSSFYGFFLGNAVPGWRIDGYGFIFTNTVTYAIASVMTYQLIMIIILYANLRNYDLKLFAADPGNSELLARLSGELGLLVYLFAFFIAILSFWVARLGLLASSVGILVILLFWSLIIALFVLYQTSLASIIRCAKWKTLNEVQEKIEKLRASKSFGTPKTMDAINKLMDFHDRVKATRNSAIDLRTVLSFINSLLLPLLAFLLGNLDKVLPLFSRIP